MPQDFGFSGGAFGPSQNGMSKHHLFEPLSAKIMHTTQSMPIQQSLPQPWPVTPGWQSFESQNYGDGLLVQEQNTGNNGYSENQQQDYVPFDEGEDFYGNEGDTGTDNDPEKNKSIGGAEQHSEHNPNIGVQYQSNNRNPKANAPATSEPQVQVSGAPSHPANGDVAPKPITDANERAAQLRARLMADKQRKSATPTPMKSSTKPETLDKAVIGPNTNKKAGQGNYRGKTDAAVKDPLSQMAAEANPDDKSSKMTPTASSIPTTSQADIESLFSEIKAGMSGRKISDQAPIDRSELTSASLENSKENSSEVRENVSVNSIRHRSDGKSPASEVSELGEIREDIAERGSIRQAPEPINPTDIKLAPAATELTKPTDGKSSRPINQSKAQLTGNKGVKSAAPGESAKPSNAVRPVTTSALSSHPQGLAQPSQAKRERPRMDRPYSSYGAGRGYDSWRRDSEDNSGRQTQEFRSYPNGSERTPYERDRQFEDSKHESVRSTQADKGRPAIKANESTDARRNDHVQPQTVPRNPDHSKGNQIVSLISHSDSPKNPVGKDAERSNIMSESHQSSDVPSRELADVIDPSIFANQQMYEDILDWLELTDWNDVSYRSQRLARHRKKKALDVERAEIEREEQLELEQRSRSIRARSILPLETGALHTVFSPQVLRTSSGTAMAPPPIPSKEFDDPGMKIKDLANPEAQATAGIDVNVRNGKPLAMVQGRHSVATKRERADDVDVKPTERAGKLPRLDIKNRSQDTNVLTSPAVKDESLDSRITRYIEPRSAGHNRISRSPDRQQRSSSPAHRRASDTGGYCHRPRGQFVKEDRYSPRGSRNVSPDRRDSGARGLSSYQEPPRFDRDFESRTQYGREFEPNSNYRPRGGAKGRFNNYRGNYGSYGTKGGTQGRAIGSDSLNLNHGGQLQG